MPLNTCRSGKRTQQTPLTKQKYELEKPCYVYGNYLFFFLFLITNDSGASMFVREVVPVSMGSLGSVPRSVAVGCQLLAARRGRK